MTEQTTLITEWLKHPHRLSVKDQQHLNVLLAKYPYLVPAQWMQNSEEYAVDGFSKNLLHKGQLFMGNWLHYYSGLQALNEAVEPLKVVVEHQEELVSEQESAESILNEEETIILDELMIGQTEKTAYKADDLIQPLFVDNYFQHQGIEVSDDIPEEIDESEAEKSLMVMMGFDEWLLFLKKKNEAKKSEEEDKAMLRSMWQREKLAAAMGEEDDNIPEAVFEMAINSIDKQDIMVSEPLAEIHVKQGRFDKAIEIYRKLSLQNPEKKTYFAAKINHLNKENLL
ncbi:MAG: hypothetical protein V4561_04985 [Bacteroidota bacterium]